ncbi:polysaccharide deacetylase family protein [Aetokthonos hydrillicola Thurmond2011]|uniref:Polysaccharide deacetylase family protein n=2 Tax=Aetokthonos TaxID=1550243 RepID=A0AAP5MDU2_9CYAN|nr:polysaccharide deacetylase family protein [Aetokthonos hydrillicola Thurmond2011]
MTINVSTWATQPSLGVQNLVQSIGPYVFAYLNRSSWPTIHKQAKLARVPILMYHDILPQKQVFFDVTPEELEKHFQLIKEQGLTPITLDQLMTHLQTGLPLPEKPVLLTFDDGYGGHYQYVYPLLKKYGYPAVFSVYTSGIGQNTGRSHVSWEQLKEMAASPLVTIASHSVSHPEDLRAIPDDRLQAEVTESKTVLETNLGIPIRYFTYPAGKYDERVARAVYGAGYQLALTMNDVDERYAGASDSLLAVSRFGQSKIKDAIAQAWGGPTLPQWKLGFDFSTPIQQTEATIDKISLVLISGGKPITIHADSRYQVSEILAKSGTNALAAVDGGFFSLKLLNSNFMIGPVLSQVTNQFIPGDRNDIPRLVGRPLVLISPTSVSYIPFDPLKHNTLEGIKAEMPNVTDAFVAAAWLVRDGQPQEASTFKGLYGFDQARYRAFWGLNSAGVPTIGVSRGNTDAVSLGKALAQAGLQDAVMVDSGQSTSLVYKGKSLVSYTPRPVPHVVALVGSESTNHTACTLAANKIKNRGT